MEPTSNVAHNSDLTTDEVTGVGTGTSRTGDRQFT